MPIAARKRSPLKAAPRRPRLPFWKRKTMEQMSGAEWESLCDGCGRCCLNKLQEEGSDKTYFTDVACKLLDCTTARCKDYKHRQKKVKDCVKLTPKSVRRIVWLPPTCAYRLIADGRDLYTGGIRWSRATRRPCAAAGVSVIGRVHLTENDVPDDKLEEHIVAWPGKGVGRK